MRRSRSLTFALACAACSVASAQNTPNTQVIFEASNTQGQSWSPTLSVQPGETVHVRIRVGLTNQGTNTVLGLAGLSLHPSLSRWDSLVDECLPFTDPVHGVPEEPQTNTGRISPFASGGLGSTPASLGCYVYGDVLRFRPWTPTPDPLDPSWGIGLGQVPQSIGGTNFRAGTDVVVFRYAVRVGASGVERDLIATQDLSSVVGARASWYRTAAGTASLLSTIRLEDILPATIHVIPSPGVLAACAIGCVAFTSRRRRL